MPTASHVLDHQNALYLEKRLWRSVKFTMERSIYVWHCPYREIMLKGLLPPKKSAQCGHRGMAPRPSVSSWCAPSLQLLYPPHPRILGFRRILQITPFKSHWKVQGRNSTPSLVASFCRGPRFWVCLFALQTLRRQLFCVGEDLRFYVLGDKLFIQ